LLHDAKGRRYLIELVPGAEFHYHRGVLAHDAVIGTEDGTSFVSSLGSVLLATRPRLADYVLKMGRGATVLYPKDAGAILVWADVAPGQIVLEAGTGSGGLAMVLARAVLPGGRVTSVERREDHAARARKLIRGFFGAVPDHLDLQIGEVEDAIESVQPDRIILDIPEPWHSVAPAAKHLTPGGIFCCYLPTVPQVQTVRDAIASTGRFAEVMTFEMLMREWAIEGRSVRPSHHMVGHTGFITVARKVGVGGRPSQPTPGSE
jgi:tRNA (adenine57-N1/adenine58-N1)-methyltransferase